MREENSVFRRILWGAHVPRVRHEQQEFERPHVRSVRGCCDSNAPTATQIRVAETDTTSLVRRAIDAATTTRVAERVPGDPSPCNSKQSIHE